MQLDSLSKIQLAAFGIQYMANSMQQLKNSFQFAGKDISQGYDDMLKSIEAQLTKVYEEAADFLNAQDAISQIDINLLERPSDVLIFGKDDTETDYYGPEQCMHERVGQDGLTSGSYCKDCGEQF